MRDTVRADPAVRTHRTPGYIAKEDDMADDNRYGSYGGGFGRDYERNDDYRGYSQSTSYGSQDDRHRGFGAYSQGGGYGQQDQRDRASSYDRPQGYDRDRERDNARFGNTDANRSVPIDETDRLIASDKVEGTPVYDRRGNRLGTILNFMVEKRQGRVEYAVLSFGGFLGMGARHYPLPWNQLTYDERQGGYVVDLTERDLDRAPSHRAGEARFDRRYSSAIDSYYGSGGRS